MRSSPSSEISDPESPPELAGFRFEEFDEEFETGETESGIEFRGFEINSEEFDEGFRDLLEEFSEFLDDFRLMDADEQKLPDELDRSEAREDI